MLSLYIRETANWAVLGGTWPLKKGYYNLLLFNLSYSEVEPGTLCPVLGPSAQEGCEKNWKGSRGRQPRWLAVYSSPVRRGWRTYLVWWRGRLRNNLVAAHKYLKNNYEDEELEQTSLQQQEKFCLGIRRNFFPMKAEKTLEQVAQEGYGISILMDIQNLKKTRQSLE